MGELFVFSGGAVGDWRVLGMESVRGPSLPLVERLEVNGGGARSSDQVAHWQLRGVASNLRYATRSERDALRSVQPDLGRRHATRAALIPISKSAAWWALAQDDRRAIFEEDSHHTAIGLSYLPAIARRLHHGRDLGEPFDFLTWFEYAREDEPLFDSMLVRLRATREWDFVEREVDIRLERNEP